LTPEVLKNLEWLGVDYLIPIGGDDTLSYAVRLFQEGVKVVAIPKTMDNDVPGTDYCIGFSTCVTRIIEMANRLRTSAGSHERFWCWRSSAATPDSQPCSPPWRAPPIAASFPSSSSTSIA
jgi:6-phosphofructokinase